MPFRAFSQASVAVSSPLPVCFFFRLSFFLLFSLLLSFVQCLLEGKLSPKVTDEVGERQATKKTKPPVFMHLPSFDNPRHADYNKTIYTLKG